MQGIGLFLSAPCQNGGTHNGIKCICQDGYYGSQCENSNCKNGGTWSNGGCLCPSSFQGPECQYASEVIEVKAEVNVTLDVKLQITNHEFMPELADNTTQQYKTFTSNFKQQMKLVYSNVLGYKDVEILKLTQGSVVVDHIVILALPVTEELNTNFEKVAGQLKTQIETAAENQNCDGSSSMCLNASSAEVSKGTMPVFNVTEYCQKAAPEGYGQFYFPNLTKSGLSCISNCTKSTPGFINCNYGQCQLTKAGPQCICSEQELYWYPTERCTTRVSKLGVGLGMAIAVLVIVSAVLGAFLFRAKRTKIQFSLHLDDDSVEKWYENDYSEWNTAGSFCIRNEGADSDKGSDGTGSFKVNMESVDTSLPVHIQRPEIVVTQL
ncbi:mucin-3B-like [Trachemys scripta elegans]|uniref:mucin-3B-like n=1 Tax=Trachemys scripta elegans TaxID=31138 RepID=UPI001554E01A|nr:mucin-3B-like [Trachemys scripta elegans]